jgi:two-component system response regulator AtoC
LSPSLLPAAESRDFELVVYIQREKLTFTLPRRGRISIGRSHDNDIRVEHTSVSRQHLLLHIGDEIEVEDLNSSNGTYFLSERVEVAGEEVTAARDRRVAPRQRVRLRPGELIRVGSVLIMVHKKSPSTMHEALRPPSRQYAPAVLIDPEVKRVHELAARAAQSEITVLVLGETGVGKELLAETIHQHSKRAKKPLLRLNCAALSESLLESELFGHERGAFTGAVAAKAGLLEATDGGTVFLDEIGELPQTTQAKLLRVLEEGAVRRLGSTKPRNINVRFITATNRNLQMEVARGRFREDLYFRINKVTLTLPPLRQRKSEIEPLARFFLHEFCKESGIHEPRLTPEAVEALLSYRWPGNVRELRNAMERAPFLTSDGQLRAEHMPKESDNIVPEFPEELLDAEDEDEDTALHEVFDPRETTATRPRDERDRIIDALESCGGNQTRAAKFLGISRRTLINRLDEYNLPRPKKRVGKG